MDKKKLEKYIGQEIIIANLAFDKVIESKAKLVQADFDIGVTFEYIPENEDTEGEYNKQAICIHGLSSPKRKELKDTQEQYEAMWSFLTDMMEGEKKYVIGSLDAVANGKEIPINPQKKLGGNLVCAFNM